MADESHLLQVLQTHGENFLSCFSSTGEKKRKRSNFEESVPDEAAEQHDDIHGEWLGITGEGGSGCADEDDDFEQDDDEFTADSTNVVVFSDSHSKPGHPPPLSTRSQMKAFMSSKVLKVRQDIPGTAETDDPRADEDEDRTNAQNDAILHKLVHTTLLSGSLNGELEPTPAHRRKALAGRVLELAGTAKLGKGKKAVVEAERNRAAKRVRVGLVDKQKERERQELEEAKNLGNYHPTLKRLYEPSAAPVVRKREKGLKMGVGRFSGGMLRLSREEINAVQNSERGGRGGRKKGGRGRARGGKA